MSSIYDRRGPSEESEKGGFEFVEEFDELFLSHHRWMELTRLTFGVRSPQLLALDESIKRAEKISNELYVFDAEVERFAQRGYSVARAEDVKTALAKEAIRDVRRTFDAWATSEGDWRESRRNKENGPSILFIRLCEYIEKYPDLRADRAAVDHIVESASEFVGQLFRGAKVRVRGADFENVVATGSQASNVLGALSTLGGTLKQGFDALFRQHFGAGVSVQQVAQDPFWAKELAKCLPTFTRELVKLLPAIGVGVATAQAAMSLLSAHTTEAARFRLLHVGRTLPVEDVREALGAIRHWQTQDIAAQRVAAAQQAATAVAGLTAILAPGAGATVQAVTQAANAIVTASAVLADLGMQYRESKALEQYLQNTDKIDRNIFAISPLVGAYYLLNVPISTLSIHLVPFDSPTFHADTLYLRESGDLKLVMSESQRLLGNSKFRLFGTQGLEFRTREDKLLRQKAVDKATALATSITSKFS